MIAHIISIGDELLIGQTVNTNAATIGEALSALGIPPTQGCTVADDMDAILAAFGRAWDGSDIVITTGGLGPTRDDITREAVCRFFRTDLVFSELVLGDIRDFFSRRRRSLLDAHKNQALVPASASVIRNPYGTAPGYHFQDGNRHFFCLPGVPWEMRHMLDDVIVPLLRGMADRAYLTTTFATTGIPESMLAESLRGIDELMHGSALAYLPSQFGVRLRLTTTGADAAAVRDEHDALRKHIRRVAGEFMFGEGDATLSACIGALLRERGGTLAVAESCSGGALAGLVTETPGSSAYFDRGVVAYSNASKTALLGVPPDLIAGHGAVSGQAAVAMADGIRASSDATYGLSSTGIAGPDGGSADKPVGLVWLGISAPGLRAAYCFHFGEDRNRIAQRAAQAALDLLRRHLLGLPAASPLVSDIHLPS